MPTLRINIDLLSFQQMCRGEIAFGYAGTTQIEMCLQDIPLEEMARAMSPDGVKLIADERMEDTDVFLGVLDRMEKYGGSFVKNLSAMCRRADPINRRKCILTWPEYFRDYLNAP